MFEKIITATPFSSQVANSFFPNIIGNPFRTDVSFLSVMRAFLGTRMPKDEQIALSFTQSSLSAKRVEENTRDSVFDTIMSSIDLSGHGRLWVHSLRGGEADNNACIEVVSELLPKRYEGYSFVPKFTEWFRKAFKTQLYINEEQKSAVIFVDRLSIKKLHVLLIGIPVALPWYFSRERGFTADETRLIESFSNPDVSLFEAAIQKLSDQYDFRAENIRRMLSGFEVKHDRERVTELENEIRSIDRRITEYNDEIGNQLREKSEKNIVLLGLMQKLNSSTDEDSEIMRYCIENRGIVVESVTDSELVFSYVGYLQFFDEDAVELHLANYGAMCYAESKFSREETEKLLRAIFLDQTLRVKFCAAYRLRLAGSVSGLSHHTFDGAEFVNAMPNPHIQYHACLGNYSRYINQFLQNRNYIGAIDQCVASSCSLNWGDGIVLGAFFRDLIGSRSGQIRCIELPNGSYVNAKEAIAWLNAQEESSDEQTTQAQA